MRPRTISHPCCRRLVTRRSFQCGRATAIWSGRAAGSDGRILRGDVRRLPPLGEAPSAQRNVCIGGPSPRSRCAHRTGNCGRRASTGGARACACGKRSTAASAPADRRQRYLPSRRRRYLRTRRQRYLPSRRRRYLRTRRQWYLPNRRRRCLPSARQRYFGPMPPLISLHMCCSRKATTAFGRTAMTPSWKPHSRLRMPMSGGSSAAGRPAIRSATRRRRQRRRSRPPTSAAISQQPPPPMH